MDLGNFGLFKALTGRMDWLGNRQRVIAQNIANVNTPGFVPKDVVEPSFDSHLRTVRMTVTDPAHSTGHIRPAAAGEEQLDNKYATTISGNSVDLETELRKVSETGMRYQMMINLYQKHIGLLKTAIGRPGA